MIVFNLSCSQDHAFDGWFQSADDFERQQRAGLVECPMCGDAQIQKCLSAPRLNFGASAPVESSRKEEAGHNKRVAASQEVVGASMMQGLQSHMLAQFKQFVLANTENVGTEFAETARRIHYGEEAHRNIRGRVSGEEAQALREEGIETLGLPPGIVLDEGVQ
jgi:hypothetical protein